MLKAAGFTHGFSLRTGGVSKAPFDSLNLGRAVGDNLEHVEENVRRFAAGLGVDPKHLYETSQVHANAVRVVHQHDDVVRVRAETADALIGCECGTTVGIRTADCVPLLIADKRTGAVAAVHAGWRGVVAGVVSAALQTLTRETRSESPSAFIAAIGPHIRACCFEVGLDVADSIAASTLPRVIQPGATPEKRNIDLALGVTHQLAQFGMTQVDDVGGCTYCAPEQFFSFRRDGNRSGRHLSVIAARP